MSDVTGRDVDDQGGDGHDDASTDAAPTPTPDVTVPPWLRTGPTPGPQSPAPQQSAPQHSGPGRSDEAAPAGSGAPSGSPGDERWTDAGRGSGPDVPSTRITLGARGGAARREHDEMSTLPLRPEPQAAAPRPPAPSPAPAAQQTGSTPPPVDRAALSGNAPGPDVAGGATDTAAASATGGAADTATAAAAPARSRSRLALLAVAGLAVLGGSAVLGYLVVGGASEPVDGATTGCVDSSGPDVVSGSGPGTLDTPAGTVLAFDHAYYVQRSAEKAFEAVAPSSRMTVEQLREDGVEELAEGTTHCVQIREISPTLLDVELTEYPPDGDPVLIRQHVRVNENPDGSWGIVSITPAG